MRLPSEATSNGRHYARNLTKCREERAGLCARYRIIRWHDDCGGLDGRIGHLHCGSGYFAANGIRRRPASHLDSYRTADDFRCALLRGARCSFPSCGWSIRLLARSVLAALGIPVRLDALPGDSDGADCGGRPGNCPLAWAFVSPDFL